MSRTTITEITPEERARFPEWVEKWTAIGLCTEEADRATFEDAARRCYGYAGLQPPKRIIWVESPLTVCVAGPMAAAMLAQPVGQSKAPPKASCATMPPSQVHQNLTALIAHEPPVLHEAALRATREATGQVTREPAQEALTQAVRSSWYHIIGGQFWAAWPAYTSFYREVLDLDLPGDLWDRDRAYADTVKSACWWWPHPEFIVVSNRPAVIRRNAQGQLHRDGGPAIQFRDGWSLYALNGVQMPKEVVETSAEMLNPRLVVEEKNADRRREIVRKIGVERVCAGLGATVLDRGTDDAGQPCEVLNLELGDKRPRPYIKLRHPGIGTYHIEGVPPTVKTVEAALKYRLGDAPLQWQR